MTEIRLDATLRRAGDMLCAEVDGEIVMMDAAKGVYFGLNDIASDVWRRLSEPVSPAALIAALAEAYEGEAGEIRRDVLALLGQLAEQGLIQIDSPLAA